MDGAFKWLHFSDIHVGMNEQDSLWPRYETLLLADLEVLHKKTDGIDLIVFSGDLTQRGLSEEFDRLDEIIGRIRVRLRGLGSDAKIVTVPGNHDLARPSAQTPHMMALQQFNHNEALRRTFWEQCAADPKNDEERAASYQVFIAKVFERYLSWKDRAIAAGVHIEPIVRGWLPGDAAYQLATPAGQCGIIGLNSSWLQLGASDYYGHLHVDTRQILAVTGNRPDQWALANAINLLVCHHPTDWLGADAREQWTSDIYPVGRFDLHLFGHMHEPSTAITSHGGGLPRRAVQAASLFGLETYGNGEKKRIQGYSANRLEFDGKRKRFTSWPRALVPQAGGGMRIAADHSQSIDEATSAFTLSWDDARAQPAMPEGGPDIIPLNPFMADVVPTDTIHRSGALKEIKKALLHDPYISTELGPSRIAVALKAQGGLGKTRLANIAANDAEIVQAFPDGILWVTLGENPPDLLGKVNGLIRAVMPGHNARTTPEAVAEDFRLAFAKLRCLIVVDDVWRESDLRAFLEPAPDCARLITARNAGILPSDGSVREVEITPMVRDEAAQLLLAGIPKVARHPPSLNDVADRLNHWPLALSLANGMIRRLVVSRRYQLERAVQSVNDRLDAYGAAALQNLHGGTRNSSLDACFSASIAALDDANAEALPFLESFAAFAEDADIPIPIVEKLWEDMGRSGVHADEMLDLLQDFSFFASIDRERQIIRLHDLIQSHLQTRIGDAIIDHHARLAEVAERLLERPDTHRSARLYGLAHAAWHWLKAGNHKRRNALLLNPRWITDKLAFRGANALAGDYLVDRSDDMVSLIGDILRARVSDLAEDLDQAPLLEILVRLDPRQYPQARSGCETLARGLRRPYLQIRPGSFAVPSPLVPGVANGQRLSDSSNLAEFGGRDAGANAVGTFFGHGALIRDIGYSSANLIITGSDDRTAAIWRNDGTRCVTLENVPDWIRAVSFSGDGSMAATGSDDGVVRTWDVLTGAMLTAMDQHRRWIRSLAYSLDGNFIISGSDGTTALVQTTADGEVVARLRGHNDAVTSIACDPSGSRVVTGSADQRAIIWDLKSGEPIRPLVGHTNELADVAFSSDGSMILTGSHDCTARLWNATDGNELIRFKGHQGRIMGVAFLPGGRYVLTASYDRSMRLWDLRSGGEAARCRFEQSISAIALSPDGATIAVASGRGIFLTDLVL